ncbi:MAG: hypothetical protein A3I05_00610 [Deltaproteobacteria bacterium RIFCSPLOWO2_02_FULL_44_10]|nr:MAG: hypothetical protein A3C46_09700 [Deltaproteobacteria bacterium RIFCSPHIGHO2_02_FULL_44_16]OGQ45193.1 MAG: hypothetical protein A3I05_00610 [Deltaproteobacteria bacterium RIFCSPLOWO2_02_FULL_44_10]
MAEASSQEKTEDATPKRLRDARKKGQVARSRDMNTIVLLIAAFLLLVAMKGMMGEHLRALMQGSFDVAARKDLTIELLFLQAQQTFFAYIQIMYPFLLALSAVALAVSFFQTGPVFSPEPMKPQLKRLNIIENLKNMFKMTTFIELLKNIAKVSLIFLLAYLVIYDRLRDVVLTTQATPEQSMKLAAEIVTDFLIKVFIVFIFIAIIDFMVQRWQYKKNLRMTKEEVKREYKQDEGDPLIKSQRRQLHQQLATTDAKQAVSTADAVITNPTEVAVAVKYNDKEMVAPTIVAKGQRLFAQTIREFAEEAHVPIVQNVPLAWALLEIDIGEEIPEDLYQAVAEILVYVYKLREGVTKDPV